MHNSQSLNPTEHQSKLLNKYSSNFLNSQNYILGKSEKKNVIAKLIFEKSVLFLQNCLRYLNFILTNNFIYFILFIIYIFVLIPYIIIQINISLYLFILFYYSVLSITIFIFYFISFYLKRNNEIDYISDKNTINRHKFKLNNKIIDFNNFREDKKSIYGVFISFSLFFVIIGISLLSSTTLYLYLFYIFLVSLIGLLILKFINLFYLSFINFILLPSYIFTFIILYLFNKFNFSISKYNIFKNNLNVLSDKYYSYNNKFDFINENYELSNK